MAVEMLHIERCAPGRWRSYRCMSRVAIGDPRPSRETCDLLVPVRLTTKHPTMHSMTGCREGFRQPHRRRGQDQSIVKIFALPVERAVRNMSTCSQPHAGNPVICGRMRMLSFLDEGQSPLSIATQSLTWKHWRSIVKI